MSKTLTAILAIILSLGILCAGCSGQSPQVGDAAPDFQFQVGEQSISLSDFKGSPVLLNFWASYCAPCAYEMPYLQQIWDGWQGEGLVLLAINSNESSSDVESFMQSAGLSFPVLLDRSGTLALQYAALQIPVSFFIDKKGIIQEVHVGPFQSTAEIEEKLNQLFD